MVSQDKERPIEILNKIYSPADLKGLNADKMPKLADEIRQELVRITSKNGGHLASNLGVVELTMAIHRVFDVPEDHLIFDVGHQSYVHKMLTGRYEKMDTLRTSGGISGFTNRSESEYDCFGAGHSSTSLSSALGFAISDKLEGRNSYTIAVIGDGAYTGGMIHEALNNCRKDLNLIIVMNENEMSISKNIGRFATNLSKLRTTSGYFKTKRATGAFLKKIPLVGKLLFRFVLGVKKAVKNALYGSNYFESMGLTYLGPIDGNDYEAVDKLLREAKKLNESVVVHIKTKKGKGYEPAESAPDLYHGMQPCFADRSSEKNFSTVAGETITGLADEDKRICAITAAMCDGTGLCSFKNAHSDRFFDVGIAEEHALTFAAGLASNGMKPYAAIYSTFLQRGYDSIIHDIALQRLPCVMCVDRAGLNAGDGATHHGIFDVAFLSEIPNVSIYTPITYDSLRAAIYEANNTDTPCAIRYPSGYENKEIVESFYKNRDRTAPSAVSDMSENERYDAVVITHGRIVLEAMKAKKKLSENGVSVGIILLEKIKPYAECAENVMKLMPNNVKAVVFLEEEIRSGGMGMNLSDTLLRNGRLKNIAYSIVAVDDSFVEKREVGQHIYNAAGVDADSVADAVNKLLS